MGATVIRGLGGFASICFAILVLISLAWGQGRPAPPAADQIAAPNRPGWSVDARTGCWLWNQAPISGEVVRWSGSCGSDGRATGRGVVEWRAAEKMIQRRDGEYRDGKASGRGVATFATGNRYEGEYRNGKFNGRGVYAFAAGNRYEGEFRDDQFDGRGVYRYANGDRFEGEFRDDKFNGRGVFTFANGDRFEGEFRDDKANGRGIFIFANGVRQPGEFRDGCLRDGSVALALGRYPARCR